MDPHSFTPESPDFQDEMFPETGNIAKSPTNLYHHMGLHCSDSIAARKEKKRLSMYGLISGLPSTLEFSSTETDLVEVFVDLLDGEAGMQTRIVVDRDEFCPGSIVMFKTWVVGSGLDEGTESTTTVNQLKHFSVSLYIPHTLKSLWSMLGYSKDIKDSGKGLDYMYKLGSGILGSSNLWHTKLMEIPVALREALSGLGLLEINALLYRTNEEENDLFSGMLIYF